MPNGTLESTRKYNLIKKKVCEKILNSWPEENRLPPIKELACELGTGESNTFRAVQELVKEGFLISRPKMGTFINNDCENIQLKLQEILHPAHKRFSDKWIQIITSEAESGKDFYRRAIAPFIDGISQVTPHVTQEIASISPDVLKNYDQSDVLVLINPNNRTRLVCGPSQILLVISTNPRYVVGMTDRFDFLSVDDIQGSVLAGKLLKRYGWEKVCFLGKRTDYNPAELDPTTANRLQGLAEGLGHPILPEQLLCCYDYSITSGAQVVSEWLNLNPRPSAIFAACDELAIGFISGALSHNLKPGKDYQIIGFDGHPLGKQLGVGIGTLTSIDVPLEKIGTMAAKMLIERLSDPYMPSRKLLMGCTLFEGNTVTSEGITAYTD